MIFNDHSITLILWNNIHDCWIFHRRRVSRKHFICCLMAFNIDRCLASFPQTERSTCWFYIVGCILWRSRHIILRCVLFERALNSRFLQRSRMDGADLHCGLLMPRCDQRSASEARGERHRRHRCCSKGGAPTDQSETSVTRWVRASWWKSRRTFFTLPQTYFGLFVRLVLL